MTPTPPRTFLVPDGNWANLTDKIAKLAKRAAKLGCLPPTLQNVGESTKIIHVVVGEIVDELGRTKQVIEDRVILLHHVQLVNPDVRMPNGWEFVATIEHTDEGNVLHTAGGAKVPNVYRTTSRTCDHCQMVRRRTETFVVKSASDEYKQVGRNCLKDFLGIDAEKFAAIAELVFEASELAEASEEFSEGGGSYGSRFELLDRFLPFVAEVITRVGWCSRTTAKEQGREYDATSNVAQFHMDPPKDARLEWRQPSPESFQTAKDAIAWCSVFTDAEVEESDYLHNIRVIARRGVLSHKQFGYAASIVSGYLRHLGDLKRAQRLADQAISSRYMGTVGERIVFKLTVDKVLTIQSDMYGDSSLHLMYDSQGNRFTWKSSTTTLKVNADVVLLGTVKKHTDYKGVAQTELSRCEEVEIKKYIVGEGSDSLTVEAIDEKNAKKAYLVARGLIRAPRGLQVRLDVS